MLHRYQNSSFSGRGRAVCMAVVMLCSTGPMFGQVVLNEACAKNEAVLADPSGAYPDWIELHNTGSEAVDLHSFYLSDKSSQLDLWRLPAVLLPPGGFLVLFSGDPETAPLRFPFRIAQDGESLHLSTLDLASVSRLDIPALEVDHSFGLSITPNGGAQVYDQPTPGAANTTTGYPGYAPTPLFSKAPGFYASGSTLTMDAGAATIRWTHDGRDPSPTSAIYTTPIGLDSTMVIKARSYTSGFLPSPVVVTTYLINEQGTLPVISLSTHPDSLFHPELGIYVPGPNADPEYPHYGANFWEDRSIATHVEFYEANGDRGISQLVDLKIHGGRRSRNNPQRPLRLTARDRYGEGLIRYPLFAERLPVDSFKTLVLRNSGADFCLSQFRDGLFHQIALHHGLDIDVLAFRPARTYVNGAYWGMLNIRERVDRNYLALNFGADRDSLLLMEEEDVSIQGDTIHFHQLKEFIGASDLNDPAAFAHVDSLMDLNSFVDYFALEIYAGNVDWPSNNLKFWKPSITSGKWRYLMYDLDATMNIEGWIPMDVDMFYWILDHRAGFIHAEIFRGLLENTEFRRTFLNRLADLMNTALSQDEFQAEVDRIKAMIAPEVMRHFDRWQCWQEYWEIHANGLIPTFGEIRPAIVRDHVLQRFALPNTALLEFDVFPPGAGSLTVNSLHPDLPFAGTYFNGNAIDVTVHPGSGYVFDHWRYSEEPDQAGQALHLQRSFATSGSVTAYFRSVDEALHVFPNPTEGALSLALEARSSTQATIRIHDLQGRTLNERKVDLHGGMNEVPHDMGSLAAGVYIIGAEVDGVGRSTRVVKY